jgi:FkbM family methyltransferase
MTTPQNSTQTEMLENTLRELAKQIDILVLQQRVIALGPSRVCEFVYRDEMIKFFLPMAHLDLIQRHILNTNRFYEQSMLEKVRGYINSNSVVLDIGSNIGNHAIYFSKVCKAAAVYAFEPMKVTYGILQKNIELNSATTVKPHNIAIGAHETSGEISRYSSSNMGGAEIRVTGKGAYEVRPLDSFNFEKVDFVKIDVEGSQLDVLRGGKNVIQKHKPIIWVECRTTPPHEELSPVREFFSSIGYQIVSSLDANNHIFKN